MVPPCSDRISRVPPYSRINTTHTHTGLSPAMAGLSRPFRLSPVDHWPRPLSLATTDGISLMSVPPGTEMFQFPGFASYHYGFMIRYPLPGGLPHSDIHGSKPARGSPWLFAACHVLHRLLVPRHPPNALIMLEIVPPCTETILRTLRVGTRSDEQASVQDGII